MCLVLGGAAGVVAGCVRALVRALGPLERAPSSLRERAQAVEAASAALAAATEAFLTTSESVAKGLQAAPSGPPCGGAASATDSLADLLELEVERTLRPWWGWTFS